MMTVDIPSFLVGLFLGLPMYLFLDRFVYPLILNERVQQRRERER